jgi:hypothetical protein
MDNTLFNKFIENFGGWKSVEPCQIKDLPFIEDIKLFFDRWENERSQGAVEISATQRQANI